MAETKKRKASVKKKAAAKVVDEVEVPVEESKSEVEAEVVLTEEQPVSEGRADAEPEEDAGDGAGDVQEPAAARPVRSGPVTPNVYTS